MDHLLLPSNPTSPRPRVPYVCSTPYVCDTPYDGGDFLTYPIRAGGDWNRVLPAVDSPSFWYSELSDPIEDAQLESFLQCWLFFGLLHELLGPKPQGLYQAKDYLEKDDEGEFVHTRGLATTLREWCQQARGLDEQAKITTKVRLTKCIKLAYNALSCLAANAKEPSHGHPDFKRPVRTSILSICEMISAAGDLVLDVLPDVDFLYFSRFATFDNDEKTLMRQNGWCPSLIALEETTYTSIALYVYLQYLPLPLLGRDHCECSIEQCNNMQINTATYAPSHTSECPTCDAIGPQLDAVASCLDASVFPVLDVIISPAKEVSLNVLPYKDGMAYVALSHVWVDGLGNPTALTLPKCQIVRLQVELQEICGQTFTWLEDNEERRKIAPNHLYLWCDSLLCPIQIQPQVLEVMTEEELEWFHSDPNAQRSKKLKNAALSHMRDVYAKAMFVLVLDKGLEQVRALDITPVEVATHLVTSRWMQRLWTYQEAALPTKLLIKFADTILDYRDLMLQMLPFREDPAQRSMCLVVLARCRALRSYQSSRARGGPDLRALQDAIRYRGVTFASDEPLCAGTILGLDLAMIAAGTTNEARMAILWSLVAETPDKLPDNIIFNKSPRLPDIGFRWAPSSFRQLTTDTFHSLAAPGSSRRARLTDTGLHVRYSGWRIKSSIPAWGAVGPDWKSLSDGSDILHIQQKDGRWFTMSKSVSPSFHSDAEQPLWSLMKQDPGAKWAVIIDSDEMFGPKEGREGVLGVLCSQKVGLPVFSSRAVIALTPLEPRFVTIMTAAEEHAKELQRSTAFIWYQLCFAIDCLATMCILRLPTWLGRPLSLLYRIPIYWLSRIPLIIFVWCLTDRGHISTQSEAVADAMKKAKATNIAGHIGIFLAGSMAVVAEIYGPEHEWCVE